VRSVPKSGRSRPSAEWPKPAIRAGESRLLGGAREYCGNSPNQLFSARSPRGSLTEGVRRKSATKIPSNSSIVGQKKNRLVREFCGNQSCFSLLSRDKCNECPRAVLGKSVAYESVKNLRKFVNRWSGVQISQPAPVPTGSIPDTSVCTYETGTHNAGVEGSSSAPAPAQDAHRIAKQALGASRAWDDDRLGFLQEHADC
jgi:hypothetical protein